MLVLRRKVNESILIDSDIRITVVECKNDGVRIAIDAPRHISVLREELSEAAQSNKQALSPNVQSIHSLQAMLQGDGGK